MVTPEQAREALTQAIQAHAEAHGNVPIADAMLSTFAVVAHWVPIEDNGREGYSMHYSSQNLPRHVVVGLMNVAADLVCEDDE